MELKVSKGIYRVLEPTGVLVIDYVSTEDRNYGKGLEIDHNTFINSVEGEESIPHHYSTLEEIKELYSIFTKVEIKPIDYNFNDNNGNRHTIKGFVVIAEK